MCCIIEEMELVGEESLWDFPSLSVSQTRIFARHTEPGKQAIVYSMRVSSENRLAMILPLPVAINSGEEAVDFYDLSGYQEFFRDLEKACFCEIITDPFFTLDDDLGASLDIDSAAANLAVHNVGDYEASYVPTVDDFSRLDSRFRLPDNVWKQLPIGDDYGFAVFQLRIEISNDRKSIENEIHPMAFEFRTRDKEKLFFPTVHVHDRQYHDKARFDHALYCQHKNARAKFKHQRDVMGARFNSLEQDYLQKLQIYESYKSIPEIPKPVVERLASDLEAIKQEMMMCKHPAPAEVVHYNPKYKNDFPGYDWYFRSRDDIQNDVDIGRCRGLLASDQKVEMMVLQGECANRDVWLGDFIPSTDTAQEVEGLTDEQMAFIEAIPRHHVAASRILQAHGFELLDVFELKRGIKLNLVRRVIDFGYSIYAMRNERNWSDYFLEADAANQIPVVQLENFKNSTHYKELTVDEFIDEFRFYTGCIFRPVEESSDEIKYVVESAGGKSKVPLDENNHAGDEYTTGTEVGVSLDLARTYIDMGDRDEARNILNEIIIEGNNEQKETAMKLLQALQ
jgi:FimV-like protein